MEEDAINYQPNEYAQAVVNDLEPGDKVTYDSGGTTYGGVVTAVDGDKCTVNWQIMKHSFSVSWEDIQGADNNPFSSALFGAPQDNDVFNANDLTKQAGNAW